MSAITQVLAWALGILLAIAFGYMATKADQDNDKTMKGVLAAVVVVIVIIGAILS